ncbi:hypothetical protein BJY01DRAFT_168988 [Aspergillus pseudoustus]|uniref:RING-type domain-containing protein n=1 Tax=Aspergillus pseudoustus TaxID=1810923 RepID=A0ABR4K3R3_9EURO
MNANHSCETSCRCGYEFCYVCRNEWKSCRCTIWKEHRLMDRAGVLASRNVQGPPAARDVQAVAARIRAGPHCTDPGRCVDEGDQCEECGEYLPDFILECRNCQLRVCRRCKLNRLKLRPRNYLFLRWNLRHSVYAILLLQERTPTGQSSRFVLLQAHVVLLARYRLVASLNTMS